MGCFRTLLLPIRHSDFGFLFWNRLFWGAILPVSQFPSLRFNLTDSQQFFGEVESPDEPLVSLAIQFFRTTILLRALRSADTSSRNPGD